MAWVTPRTWVAAETLTAALLNEQVRDNWNAAFPVGSLHWRMQAATSAETTVDGFGLEANGVNVSRATYSSLQTKLSGLSYPFGSGDGSTTMGLPDLSGRTPFMMAASGHADVNGLGDSDGLAKASRTPRWSVASHTHTGPSHTHSTPAHSHGLSSGSVVIPNFASYAGGGNNAAQGGTYSLSGSTATEGSGTTGAGGTGATGSGGGGSGNHTYQVVGIMVVKY